MADQNNANDNAAAGNNADNLNVAEGNANVGEVLWDEVLDPNFVPDVNAYDYEAHHEVLFQNLEALQQENMYIFQNGFPMPQQLDVQPEPVAHSSSFQPSGFNEGQPVSDSLPDVPSFVDNYISGAPHVLPNMEGWGYVSEAYQSECSSLSEFVASSESQQEALLSSAKEVNPVGGSSFEIPEGWVRGVNVPAFMPRFDDGTEKDQRNPPNTPVIARSSHNTSSRSLGSPNSPTSPGLCLRSAIKVLRTISEENKNVLDIERAEGRKGEDTTESENARKTKSCSAKVQVKRKSGDYRKEENIQISFSQHNEQESEGADKLFIKFGSFMVILVLLFPLAIIACLQGLLPEKYVYTFLALLILSIVGACYCFFKACYVRNDDDEEPDSTTNSRVKYGSIQSPKPGPSSEPA